MTWVPDPEEKRAILALGSLFLRVFSHPACVNAPSEIAQELFSRGSVPSSPRRNDVGKCLWKLIV